MESVLANSAIVRNDNEDSWAGIRGSNVWFSGGIYGTSPSQELAEGQK